MDVHTDIHMDGQTDIEAGFIRSTLRMLELSFPRTFAPRNKSSMEISLPRTFVPWTFVPSHKLSLSELIFFDRPNNSKYWCAFPQSSFLITIVND